MQILEAIEEIKTKAKVHNTKECRIIRQHVIGKCIRQGDIYIHMVANDHPVGNEINIRQIVDGTSIGSRHILTGTVKVYEGTNLPNWVNRMPLGKAFDVVDACVVTHPEHAHVQFVKGRYQVTHQIDLRTMQRVSD